MDKSGDVIWHYKPDLGIWKPDGIPYLEKLVTDIMGDKIKTRMFDEVKKLIQVKTYMPMEEFQPDPNVIVMEDGAFNIKYVNDWSPHLSQYYATSRIPVTYDYDADCPKIQKFFEEIYPENPDILYEIIGYCLLKKTPFHNFFILLGDGANGKGTYINLIKRFLGEENVSSETLQQLDENRFRVANLHGKMANLCNDIPANPLKHTGMLKQTTSGDMITAEKKNLNPFQFENHAKLIFSCNQLPPTYDNTTAFFRRQIVLQFKQKFVDGINADPDILDKICTKEEMSGLFNRAIEALRRLLKTHKFTGIKSVEERTEEYILESNPAQYFLQNYVVMGEDLSSFLPKDVLYTVYVDWCRLSGFMPCESNYFSRQGKRFLPYIREGKPRVDGKQVKSWYGIEVKEELKDELYPETKMSTVSTMSTANIPSVSVSNQK